jgi:hypothetical protein
VKGIDLRRFWGDFLKSPRLAIVPQHGAALNGIKVHVPEGSFPLFSNLVKTLVLDGVSVAGLRPPVKLRKDA